MKRFLLTLSLALTTLFASAQTLLPTPDVPMDSLFRSIIAPHKGKIVLVDLWATWCGPCRSAIKMAEEWKKEELATDQIVWIYITNDTSPIETYNEMIPEINGLHYRVTTELWDYMKHHDYPEYVGLPTYIIVHPDGTYNVRLDLFPRIKIKEALLEELKQMQK